MKSIFYKAAVTVLAKLASHLVPFSTLAFCREED
jgi:hypothetical protein